MDRGRLADTACFRAKLCSPAASYSYIMNRKKGGVILVQIQPLA